MTTAQTSSLGHAQVTVLDMDALLEEYRRRQMLEHLTGPIVSLCLHLTLLGVLFVVMVRPTPLPPPTDGTTVSLAPPTETPPIDPRPPDLPATPGTASLTDILPTFGTPPSGSAGAGTEATGGEEILGGVGEARGQAEPAVDIGLIAGVQVGPNLALLPPSMRRRLPGGLRQMPPGDRPPPVTREAVAKALTWVKEHQNSDGSWSQSQPVAMTGLGVLTYLAHGELTTSKDFGPTVEKAIRYLVTRMNAADGIIEREYSHGIATYALAEAYCMTRIGDIKPAMEKGLKTIINGQQMTGGWDYGFKKGERWDLSVSGWQVQALKAGFLAGAEQPGLLQAKEKALAFLKTENYQNGFRYSAGSASTPSMQGIGALCLQFLGDGTSKEARAAVSFINDNVTVSWDSVKPGDFSMYAWYYQTQVMFQAGKGGWKKWEPVFSRELTRHQKPDGHWETGPAGAAGVAEYDPYLNTCLGSLMLDVYIRFLPTYLSDPASPTVITLGVDDTDGATPATKTR